MTDVGCFSSLLAAGAQTLVVLIAAVVGFGLGIVHGRRSAERTHEPTHERSV